MGEEHNFFYLASDWALDTAVGLAALEVGALHKVLLSGISEEAIVKEEVDSHGNALL